jgi:hypothetical protein
MSYEFSPTEVSVLFYCRPDWESLIPRSKKLKRYQRRNGMMVMLATLTNTDIHHASLMFKRDDKCIVLATGEHHRSKLIDEEAYHSTILEPKYIVELGSLDVSIKQIQDYLKTPHRVNRKDMVYYAVLGKFLFPTVKPNCCTLLSCQLLRMIGYPIKDIVVPRDLHKYLSKQYTIKPWEEYTKERSRKCN